MSRVKQRPALLVAILLYVTLDLSIAAMPGAFVFDSSESVECTQSRVRAAVETGALPAPAPDASVLARPRLDVKDRLTRDDSVERTGPRVPSWRSRALHDPAPPSEDPH